MILINSAAYINSDLISEFGKLPPALLPVQNKRLYEHQIELLRNTICDDTVHITFPQSYQQEMSEYDKVKMNELGIIPIYIQATSKSINIAIMRPLNLLVSRFPLTKPYCFPFFFFIKII